MWAVVLFFGLGAAIDPLRFGLTALMVSRSRPALHLLAFWLGGMTAGIGVAMAVLVLLRDMALGVIHDAAAAVERLTSSFTILEGGRLQITIGVLALLVAAFLVVRHRTRIPLHAGATSALAVEQRKPNALARLFAGFQAVLSRGFVFGAFAAGLGMATPPAECLIVLTAIMASEAAIGAQISAFIAFTLLLLAVVEIPLVAYLAVPRQTETVMMNLDRWVRTYRPQITQTMLFVGGIAFVAQGLGRL